MPVPEYLPGKWEVSLCGGSLPAGKPHAWIRYRKVDSGNVYTAELDPEGFHWSHSQTVRRTEDLRLIVSAIVDNPRVYHKGWNWHIFGSGCGDYAWSVFRDVTGVDLPGRTNGIGASADAFLIPIQGNIKFGSWNPWISSPDRSMTGTNKPWLDKKGWPFLQVKWRQSTRDRWNTDALKYYYETTLPWIFPDTK